MIFVFLVFIRSVYFTCVIEEHAINSIAWGFTEAAVLMRRSASSHVEVRKRSNIAADLHDNIMRRPAAAAAAAVRDVHVHVFFAEIQVHVRQSTFSAELTNKKRHAIP